MLSGDGISSQPVGLSARDPSPKGVYTAPPAHAHHLMIEAVKANVVPASRLPKVIEAWEEPRHEEFRSRSAWVAVQRIHGGAFAGLDALPI